MRKFLLIAMVMFTLPVFAQNYNMRLASIASNDGVEIWDYIYSAPDNSHLVCINEMEFATPLEIVDSLEYDERGNITKLSTWQKTEGGWIYTCYVEYEYNDKNQKIVRKNYNDFGTGFELGGIYRYSYDEEGRMSEWTLEFAGIEEFNKGIIEYNEAGYKISETMQSYNFATYYLENANLTEYEYDENNNVTRIAVSAWDAGVWTLQSATVNEYDENGNCIVSEKRTSAGTVQERKLFEYDLNILAENVFYYPNPEDDFPQLPAGRKNLLKSFEFYAQNADDMQLSYVTTYELSYEVIEGASVEEVAFTTSIYPNPAQDFVMVESSEADYIEVVDVNGKVMFSAEMNEFVKVDMSEFASGVYFVRLQANGATSVQKIMKK